jgi:hypothetical protein
MGTGSVLKSTPSIWRPSLWHDGRDGKQDASTPSETSDYRRRGIDPQRKTSEGTSYKNGANSPKESGACNPDVDKKKTMTIGKNKRPESDQNFLYA